MRPVAISIAFALAVVLCGAMAMAASSDLATTADMVARYPRTAMNPTAAALVELAADLGLDLSPWSFTPGSCGGPAPPRSSPPNPDRETYSAIGAYVGSIVEEQERLPPPPPALTAFASGHGETLESIRDLLIREPPPRWAFNIENWWDGPHPSWSLETLRSILLAQALAAVDAGDQAEGTAWLEAAWNVDEGLRSRPRWSVSDSPIELAIVRLLDLPDEVWTGRLARYDARADVRAGQLVEAWSMLRIIELGEAPVIDYLGCINRVPVSWWSEKLKRSALTSYPARAYQRAGTVEATARLRDLLDHLVQLDPCALIAGDHPGSIQPSDPWWNGMGNLLFSDQTTLWARVGRRLLEAELTAKVIEARQQRAKTGAWPESIPGIERSSCTRGSWRYSAPRGGGVLIEFVADGDWRALREPGPLRFRAK